MKHTTCAVAIGAMLALAGCQQGQEQRWIEPDSVPETRADLYRQYGPPDSIWREGDSRWLGYNYEEGKGMKLGARYYGLGLVFSRYQTQADRLWIKVGPDDRITDVEPAVNSDKLRYRLWPFGS